MRGTESSRYALWEAGLLNSKKQLPGDSSDYVLGRIEEWQRNRGIIIAGTFGGTWIFVDRANMIPELESHESHRVKRGEQVAFKWVWQGRRMIAIECWRLKLASPKGWTGLPLPQPTARMTPVRKGKLLLQYAHARKATGTEAGRQANLDFRRAFVPAGSVMNDARIIWSDLRDAQLDNVKLNRAELFATDFSKASFLGSELRGTSLVAAKLVFANFKGAVVDGSDLSESILVDANLEYARLDSSSFERADLTRASLTGATANHTNFKNACLRDVNLRGVVDLRGATVDARTYQKSGWVPGDLLTLCDAGVEIHALNEFPADAQDAVLGNGRGLTLTFDTRLHRFDPTAFDVLIASVLSSGTDVTVEERSNINAEGPGFIRISGSRPEDLIAVAEVFYEQAWRNTEEFVEQRAIERAMSSGMSLILQRLDAMRDHVVNMRASTDLFLPGSATATIKGCLSDMGRIETRYKALADAIAAEARLRHDPTDRASFVARLEADLDASIRELESQRHHLRHGVSGNAHHEHEKSLRSRILTFLRGREYNVSAETDEGGFTDLLVRCDKLGLLWIAECKIYRDNKCLEEGLLQLHTRYASGRYPAVALVILCFQRNAAAVLRKWKEYLAGKRPCGMMGEPGDISPDNLCFVTKHIHPGSGNEVSTRHVVASLYWNPQDRSGRKLIPRQ